jgi:hypothetical protein
MSLAIHTKYIGPTDRKQARIKATVRLSNLVSFSATVSYDWTCMNAELAHRQAAIALIAKHFPESVSTTMLCVGNTLENKGYVYTMIPHRFFAFTADMSDKEISFRSVEPNSYLIEGDGKQQWFKAHASWQALDMAKVAGFDETKGFRVTQTIQGT